MNLAKLAKLPGAGGNFGNGPAKKTLRKPLALASVGPQSELQTEVLSSSPSIAVLPFVNLSEEKRSEYFCDGLAEELLNALGKIEHLKVAANSFLGPQASRLHL